MEYIADFNPSEFVQTARLATRYLLVPDSSILKRSSQPPPVYHGQTAYDLNMFISSLKNVSEWMAVPKTMFDLTRTSCDKIGVGYTAFRTQTARCTSKMGRSVIHNCI